MTPSSKPTLILRNGIIYDGFGSPPFVGDVAVAGDKIVAVNRSIAGAAAREIDVSGLAVAPGFINMLSWSVETLIEDGRSQSEIRQGVTLEVMGEGYSFGPLSDEMKANGTEGILGNADIKYDIEWTTLGEYLEFLVRKGVSPNVASFVGTHTLRKYAVGDDDRPPTPSEFDLMRQLTRQSMAEGAMGLSAALIYPPAMYQSTEELIALAKEAAAFDGLYITHLRSEGAAFMPALDEFFRIVTEAGIRGEIYHLKASGRSNWHLLEEAISRIEVARDAGMPVTADMYTYNASGTDLNVVMPPWAHDGGIEALLARLQNPETRTRIKRDMNRQIEGWENMWLEHPGGEGILLCGFQTERLKRLTGSPLPVVAASRSASPEETVMDLLAEDGGRVFCCFFSMDEANVRRKIQLPWVSFCSDAGSIAPEGVFLKSNPHPRAYGSFARLLGRYVRDEGLISLGEAIRRLTSLPASVLKIKGRGTLQPGYFADIAVFDPNKIEDRADFANPHQYAVGMAHVFVNGVQVLADGEHSGALPGQVVRGPGYRKAFM